MKHVSQAGMWELVIPNVSWIYSAGPNEPTHSEPDTNLKLAPYNSTTRKHNNLNLFPDSSRSYLKILKCIIYQCNACKKREVEKNRDNESSTK